MSVNNILNLLTGRTAADPYCAVMGPPKTWQIEDVAASWDRKCN